MRGLVLATVVILKPPAFRSLTRTGVGGFRPNAIRRVDPSVILPGAGMTDKLFIGVDVSKDWLDIARNDRGEVERIDNTTQAVADFLARLQQPPAPAGFQTTRGRDH